MAKVEITDASFDAEVLKHEGTVLMDFYAPWCGPCKMLTPVLEKVAEDYKGKVKVVALNVDENNQTSINYQIMSIPTLIVFKNGEVVDKVLGFLNEERLKELLDSHL